MHDDVHTLVGVQRGLEEEVRDRAEEEAHQDLDEEARDDVDRALVAMHREPRMQEDAHALVGVQRELVAEARGH
eukprot:9485570-Lingulodinium_polyedra.AAC.1